jgi:hypothetical protein
MLMISTTVRMVDGIHSNTTSSGPRVSLDTVLVECTSGLQERFINTSSSSNNTNHASSSAGNNLLGTRWELQPCLSLVGIVTDDNDIVAGRTSQCTTITDFFLDVGDDGSFRHFTEGEDVANRQVCLFTSIDELASVHAFIGNESFGAEFIAVGISEGDFG